MRPDYEERRQEAFRKLWARIRRGFRERRHRLVVQQLPPESTLAELRRSCRLSQTDVGEKLRVGQARLSRIERMPNLRLDVLDAYARALGGTLHLLVRFPDRDARLVVPSLPRESHLPIRHRSHEEPGSRTTSG